jgi:hypothetical protein
MKKLFTFLGIFAAASFSAQNYCTLASLPAPLQTSLVAYYPFCNNTNDVSGNNYHCTGTNVTLGTDRYGNVNSAYDFNGTNASITSTVPFFNNNWTNWSVSFWMYPFNVAQTNQSCFNTLPHNSAQIAYNFAGPQLDHVHFSLNSTPTVQTWDMTQYSQGTFTTYANNTWYHVALTKNGTVWKLYINGTLDAVFSSGTPITNTLTNVMFGAIINPSTSLADQFFNGTLDDIMVYNRTLNSVEVGSLTCLNPSDPAPIAGSQTVCGNGSFTYSVPLVNGATSYSWVTPGGWSGTSTTNVIVASPGFPGVFSLEGINNCGKSSASLFTVVVNTAPTVTAAVADATICQGQNGILTAGGASTYVWAPGGGVGPNVTVNPTVTTDYTVTGTQGGCTNTAVVTQSVVICVGFQNLERQNNVFHIFPSPSDGIVTIGFESWRETDVLKIFNSMGQLLLEEKTSVSPVTFDLRHFPPGIYFVKLEEKRGNTLANKKLIIE